MPLDMRKVIKCLISPNLRYFRKYIRNSSKITICSPLKLFISLQINPDDYLLSPMAKIDLTAFQKAIIQVLVNQRFVANKEQFIEIGIHKVKSKKSEIMVFIQEE